MTIEKFINVLGEKGVFLSFVNNELKVKGDQSALTSDVIGDIKSRKEELLQFFSSFDQQTEFESIPQAPNQESYPLTSAQKRLYFLYEFDPEATAYNMPYVLELRGELDTAKLEGAFRALLERHESLRTRFVKEGETAFQQIVPEAHVAFSISQLELAGHETPEEKIRSFIQPFDLSQAPLFRISLLKVSENAHLLLTDWHHIITDGTSQAILIKDFMDLYAGKSLAALSIKYKDYATWKSKQSEFSQESLQSFWTDTFAAPVEAVELPTDHPRSSSSEKRGAVFTHVISANNTQGLQEVSTQNGATLFMTMLALLNVLLSKLSNQKDLVIGTPVAGRDHADTQKLIGLFINTLALRNHPEPSLTFRQFLAEVKEGTLKCFEYSQYPFEELIEKLNLARTTQRNPLFDVMFAVQNFEEEALKLPGLKLTPQAPQEQLAKFDLSITVEQRKDTLELSWEYDCGLFKAETIERFATYYERLIQEVSKNADQELRLLKILPEAEQVQLQKFNETKIDYPLQSIIELFQEQAESTPAKIAVILKEAELTYEELAEKSTQLAKHLHEKGIERNEIVGVLLDQSLELFHAILGINKSGAAFLPIDPSLPKERIHYMLEDSQAKYVISSVELIKSNDLSKSQVIDVGNGDLYTKNDTALPFPNSKDLAYVIYTSGTTGTPKGTLIEHGSLTNLCHWFNERYEVSQTDHTTKLAGLGFDAMLLEVFPPLLKGATIHVMDEEDRLNPSRLNAYFESNEISLSFLPTPLCEPFLKLKNNSLRVLLTGGDKLNNATHNNQYKLYDNYGPTETTVVATSFLVGAEQVNTLIGKPIANTQAYILNEEQELQPLGVSGELYIGGAQLARGYLGQPQLTSARFIASPFKPGERLYKTGDRARWLADGNIEFLGRNDDQVKVRGFRIELGEIESQLSSHAAVTSAVVLAAAKEHDKYLVAYYTAEATTTATELKAYLQERLPDYMVPSIFMKLEALPLNRSGKVDRKALPEPEMNLAETYVAPQNDIEEQLVTIWSEVLQLPKDQISTTSNFFELGGHSLKATLVVNQLLKTLQVDLPVKDLFVYQSIQGLAEHIKHQTRSEFESIPQAPNQESYPLTSAQKRLYFLYEFDPEATAYNMPYVLELRGELDTAKLEGAFRALLERHESLRTRFVKEGETAFQQIVPEAHVAFSISQLELAGHETPEEKIRSFIQPFDLSQAPLFRISLLKVSENAHLLLTDWHHIITDGTSQGILIKDFMDLYAGKSLAPLSIQYKDYAYWRAEREDLLDQQKGFWINQFSGKIPALNLPGDLALGNDNLNEGEVYLFELSGEESARIYEFLKQQKGITLFSFLMASFQVLLSRLSDQKDIIVGSPVVNRSHLDTENIIGLFLNTLPFRNYPESSKTFVQFLSEVQENALESFENQEYQFEDLISELHLQRDLKRNPLFDVFFNLLNFENDHLIQLKELTVKHLESDFKPEAKFYLTLYAKESNNQILFSCLYKSGFFQQASIQYIFDEFKKLLTLLVDSPNLELGAYKIFSLQGENRQPNPVPVPQKTIVPIESVEIEQSLVDRFQMVVQAFPDKVAIKRLNEQITYHELDIQSNRVANTIRQSETTNEDEFVPRVALLFGHNIRMIEAIWGVLKAGQAYVPMTIDQPIERMAFIIREAQTRLLLTESEHLSVAEQVVKKVGQQVKIINIQALPQNSSSYPPTIQAQPDDLAYILYTSGSTGKPKGVMQIHRNVLHYWRSYTNALNIDQEDVLTMLSNYGHDAAVMSFYGTMLNGATGILYDIKDRGLQHLNGELAKHQVTIYHSTPSVFRAFTSIMSEKASKSIRLVVMGGEPTLPYDVDRYKSLFGQDCLMVNGMGATEASLQSLFFINKSTSAGKNYVPLGLPFEGTSHFVLKADHTIADIYQEGMLVYESDFITPGYWQDRAKTDQKVLTGILTKNKRYYFSGDLARQLPDGNLEYLGRNDDQIKIRGFRIEPGEIENQLSVHPEVLAAVVLVYEQGDDKSLVAYFTAEGNTSGRDLKNYLLQKLPGYMIPATFMKLDELPLNRNGKVDRKALPIPKMHQVEKFVAPENKTEEQLVEIWSEILQIPHEQISTTSNFFELGGHSLKATLVVNQLLKKLGVVVPLKDLFVYQDIQQLSSYVQTLKRTSFQSIVPAPKQLNYPLTSAQKRLYFLYEFDPLVTAYNMPYVLSLRGELDLRRLESTFTKLIHRHESLRTRFVKDGEQAFQQIVSPEEVQFQIQDLNRATYESREALVQSFIVPFDLSQSPLFRVGIHKASDQEYLLLFDLHHIITDGTSQSILIKDFIAIYENQNLKPLKIHYKDYAYWKAQQTEHVDQQKAYWVQRFSGEIPTLNLPGDLVLEESNLTQGDLFLFDLSKEESASIHQFIKEQRGVTLFSFLLASFQVLLSRLTNQQDIIVGSPVVNRSHIDTEGIMGLFLNTLPFRNYPANTKTFIQFLRDVQQGALEAFENQEYQFEDLISELNLKRDLKRNPLFDVFFNLLNFDDDLSLELDKLRVETMMSDMKPDAKFYLTLYAKEVDQQILFSCLYKSAFFQEVTIQHIFSEYKKLLGQIVQDPNTRIGDFKVFSHEEIKLETHQPTPQKVFTKVDASEIEQTLVDRFERIVHVNQSRVALSDLGREITYRELNLQANRIARAINIQYQDDFAPRAVLLFDHNIAMITGIWGALKAGHAYVPITVDQPIHRMLHILQDAHASVILTEGTHQSLAEKLIKSVDHQVQVVNIEELNSESEAHPPIIRSQPSDLAYILYTSGSTGIPKGVMQTHRNVLHFWRVYTNALHIDHEDVLTMLSNYGHDAAVMSFFGALLNGAKGVLFDIKNRGLDGLDHEIRKSEVTIYHTTPSVFRAFTSILPEKMSESIRLIVLGGEATLPSDVDRYKTLSSDDCLLVNGLGPTESTVTLQKFIGKETVTRQNIPVGHAVESTSVFIIDENNAVADVYQEGMLVYESDYLTPGYWKDQKKTDQSILIGLFEPKKRYFLTGDVARRLPDGNIEFLGRNDEQIKVRGFRIEPGEIESQLSGHPDVKSAVVIAYEKHEEKHLVAYYSEKKETAERALKSYLRQKLPDYMVPVVMIKLEELPLNHNGKVDRTALPDPMVGHIENFVAPVNELEEQLVDIWSEILQIPQGQISTTSNFFELGGHSLNASLVVNQLLKKLQVEVSLKSLFIYQDIQHLAEHVKTLNSSDFRHILPAPKQANFPLTSAQKRLYFLYEFDSEATAYNMPNVLMLKGDLDIPRLETSFMQLIQRHESLRTQFVKEGENIFQQIVGPQEVNFEIRQYEESNKENHESLVRSFITAFDLSQAPLFRVATLKVAREQHLLLTDLHHIITDGTSQGILIKDFMDIYEEKALAPLDIHYKDYAYWRAEQTEAMDRHKTYWVERFKGDIPTLNLPGDLALNNGNLTLGDHFHFELSAEETRNIHQFIKEQKGITLFSFLLASFQVLLSRLANQEDIIVGSPVVNRSHADTEKIIGLFLNTLPLRNQPERDKTFSQFLEEVQQGALEAFENQEYQFEDLISELNLKRDLKRNPLFDVFFNLLNFEQDLTFSLDDLTIEAVETDLKPGAKFYLTLYAKEVDDQILFSCLFKSGFFQRETISYIFGEFRKLLRQLIRNPNLEIREFKIFLQQEVVPQKQQPFPTKDFTPIDSSEVEQTLIDRFRFIAQTFPGHTALRDLKGAVTYHELDRNTSRVAQAILQQNHSPCDDFVPRAALLFGHNIPMMEGVIGSLKAGHAYVPITVDQPIERMINILQDAGARVLLTEREHFGLAKQVAEQIEHPVKVLDIQSLEVQIDKEFPQVSVQPEDLAYILYTSGSTGKPKGVMQIHRNVLHFWRVYTNALHIDQEDVLTMLSNYGHDAAVMSFYGTLLNGATGVLYDLKGRGLESLDQVIRDNQVTIYHSTPSVFRAFTSIVQEKVSESIRLVVMGGETTLPSDVEQYKEQFHDNCLMINGLGPTESTITVQKFIDKQAVTRQNVPVGLPVEGTNVYILDEDREVADVYQEGMLVYESEFITPGYWNDPERTHKAVLTGLFEQGRRYYLSGDMARRLPDGNIEFLGRNDHQVKIRGYRIELGEIESQLLSHPEVTAAVVVPFEKHREKLLVVYYSTAQLAQEPDLKNFLLQKVPDYMVPSIFMQLDELPLNRNGKIDQKALPEPEVILNHVFVDPVNEIEVQLVEIWSEVLQVPKEKVSTTSNFFELGGHSLLAMHMMHLILKKLDIEIDLKMLFQYPTIQLLGEAFKIHGDQDEELDEDEYDKIYL